MRAARAELREFAARRTELIERQTSRAVRWATRAERAERRASRKSKEPACAIQRGVVNNTMKLPLEEL